MPDHHNTQAPVPATAADTAQTRDGEFYRSRVVIAEFAGAAAAFGPVHTARGLANLAAELRACGWSVSGEFKLTSVARFKDRPADWDAIASDGTYRTSGEHGR